jgi:hypothetical protein
MDQPFNLSRETFLSMAKAFGLDVRDSHIEDLYAYVQNVLPALRSIRELDLTGVEPTGPPVSLPSMKPGRGKTRTKE